MNIFVAKLNFSTQNQSLREAFEAFGEVDSASVIMDKESGRSKGFGFVEMTNDAEANAAINALDNSELDGSVIVVKKAIPKDEMGKRDGGGFNRGGGSGGGGFNRGGSGGDRGGDRGGFDRGGRRDGGGSGGRDGGNRWS